MAEILSQVSQNTPNGALQSLQHPFTKLTFSWGRLLDSPQSLPHTFQSDLFPPTYSQKTVNTWKISGMLIVYWLIIIKFRMHKQTSNHKLITVAVGGLVISCLIG